MSHSVAVVSEEYQQLLAYVERLPPGATIMYDEVTEVLGIPMTRREDRDKLRRAILRAKREYSALPGVGYQLADTATAMPILTHRLTRVDSAVRRADRAYGVIQDQFYEQLPPEQQSQVRFIGSVFGAIRLAAESGRKLYGKAKPALVGATQVIEITTV